MPLARAFWRCGTRRRTPRTTASTAANSVPAMEVLSSQQLVTRINTFRVRHGYIGNARDPTPPALGLDGGSMVYQARTCLVPVSYLPCGSRSTWEVRDRYQTDTSLARERYTIAVPSQHGQRTGQTRGWSSPREIIHGAGRGWAVCHLALMPHPMRITPGPTSGLTRFLVSRTFPTAPPRSLCLHTIKSSGIAAGPEIRYLTHPARAAVNRL